jgi:hypothetical protein
MCRRSVLALPSPEKAKRGRFAYTASLCPATNLTRREPPGKRNAGANPECFPGSVRISHGGVRNAG